MNTSARCGWSQSQSEKSLCGPPDEPERPRHQAPGIDRQWVRVKQFNYIYSIYKYIHFYYFDFWSYRCKLSFAANTGI